MVRDDDREYEQQEDAPPQEETPSHEATSSGPVTPRQLLRTALVNDDDPRFPTWLPAPGIVLALGWAKSEEHTSELQSLMRISYAVFCLKKKKNIETHEYN